MILPVFDLNLEVAQKKEIIMAAIFFQLCLHSIFWLVPFPVSSFLRKIKSKEGRRKGRSSGET